MEPHALTVADDSAPLLPAKLAELVRDYNARQADAGKQCDLVAISKLYYYALGCHERAVESYKLMLSTGSAATVWASLAGAALIRLKKSLPHGSFLPAVEQIKGMGPRKAQKYMTLADRIAGEEVYLGLQKDLREMREGLETVREKLAGTGLTREERTFLGKEKEAFEAQIKRLEKKEASYVWLESRRKDAGMESLIDMFADIHHQSSFLQIPKTDEETGQTQLNPETLKHIDTLADERSINSLLKESRVVKKLPAMPRGKYQPKHNRMLGADGAIDPEVLAGSICIDLKRLISSNQEQHMEKVLTFIQENTAWEVLFRWEGDAR